MKACVIIPYFGAWPPYLPLFLESCKNDLLDFLLITDLPAPTDHPSNVKFLKLTLSEIAEKVQSAVGVEAALRNSYKLCDLKSAYGEIFAEYLETYAFWGFGDIDLIYGDIDKFITQEDLKQYDVISGREFWVSGALALFRNTDVVNSLYRRDDTYKMVFEDSSHYSFTECSKQWGRLLSTPIHDVDFDYANFTLHIRNAEKDGLVKTRFTDILRESIKPGGHIRYSNSKVLDQDGREYLMFHYIAAKRKAWFRYPKWEELPKRYYITETGFYSDERFATPSFNTFEFYRKMRASPIVLKRLAGRLAGKIKSKY